MLINLLVKLSTYLKDEGVSLAPEQLFFAAKYILLADSLTPDNNLQQSLKPILITRIENEAAYHKAWIRLKNADKTGTDKIALYHLVAAENKIPHIEPTRDGSGLEWAPWQRYLAFCKSGELHNFENAVRKSLAINDDKAIQKWETAFEAQLSQKFVAQETDSLEDLLAKALAFRKEYSRIKRQWNKTMRALIPDTGNNHKNNEQDKIGEKRGLRPIFTQGYRANIWRWGNSELFMRPMENLKEKEVLQLQAPIRAMAERLRLRLEGMRKRHAGRVDLRKVIRASHKTFGEPMQLIRTRPKRKPARWVVLSDVSGSVKQATRLFMSFLFELRNVMDNNIRGFTFVSKVQEITDILKETHYEIMVDRIYRQEEIDFRGYSDYGVAFQTFDAIAGDTLYRDTVLLIIGDARNNKREERLDLVQKWRNKTRKVLWFNPDLPEKWDQGDSVITTYAQVVNQVYDVSTPGKLVNAIEQVVI
ncbi:VWA domain-containing protein [Candidatus Marithioploca araucensis]|uniref:VWA domain-containing protein n=1 Tax=Candidatus Marithioploca araucensis TaxID=70273 RepID=A0ABT7VU68_9GAMM|nr:VWA domain-containing protein [Candidatus Marithioploca araucensis]